MTREKERVGGRKEEIAICAGVKSYAPTVYMYIFFDGHFMF